MGFSCERCEDTRKITADGKASYANIERKDGTREMWANLLQRTKFMECPDCASKQRDPLDNTADPEPADVPRSSKRKYTKRSTYWKDK